MQSDHQDTGLILGGKAIAAICVCLFFLLFVGPQVWASERYFLDGHETLLYKSINWWYYAPAEDAGKICGSTVRYSYQGRADHSYDESSRVLTIFPEDGFAELLSVLSSGGDLRRLAALQGNKGNILSDDAGVPTLAIAEQPLSNKYSFSFNSIGVAEYRQLIKDVGSWQFVLSGKIRGLRSGKPALYRAPDNLRNCVKDKPTGNNRIRFTLRISRRAGKGVLAEFVLDERYALKEERQVNENGAGAEAVVSR